MFYSNPWVNFYYDLHFKIQQEVLQSLMDYQLSLHGKNLELFQRIIARNLKKPAELSCLLSEGYDCHAYEMSHEELKEYNLAQIEEIKKFKNELEIESKNQYEMNEVIVIWADKYSHSFRKYWHLKRLIAI